MAWCPFGLQVAIGVHQVKQALQVHVPPFPEGQLFSWVLNLFARDLVFGLQGWQQDTLHVVFVADAQDVVHV